jgi:hypothetical protein
MFPTGEKPTVLTAEAVAGAIRSAAASSDQSTPALHLPVDKTGGP